MLFYNQIFYIGLIFMLSDPLIIMSTFVMNEWQRAWYYHFFDQLMHIGLQAYLLIQMTNSKSEF